MLGLSAEPLSRSDALNAAARARAKGQRRRAIALYQRVLDETPDDPMVHGRLAPLLAAGSDVDAAWRSFSISGHGYLGQGFLPHAIGIYTKAAECLPARLEPWERLADLHVERGHTADAVSTLLRGCERVRLADHRRQLLERVFDLERWHFDATFALAEILARGQNTTRARMLLYELAARASTDQLHRVRWALFRLQPSPASAWRWMRSRLFRR